MEFHNLLTEFSLLWHITLFIDIYSLYLGALIMVAAVCELVVGALRSIGRWMAEERIFVNPITVELALFIYGDEEYTEDDFVWAIMAMIFALGITVILITLNTIILFAGVILVLLMLKKLSKIIRRKRIRTVSALAKLGHTEPKRTLITEDVRKFLLQPVFKRKPTKDDNAETEDDPYYRHAMTKYSKNQSTATIYRHHKHV